MAKKGGLGRGLSAILEDVEQAYSKEIANLKKIIKKLQKNGGFGVVILAIIYY